MSERSAADFPFRWQRERACSVYRELLFVWGDYGVRRNDQADEDDRGGHVAWEVWHWPTDTVESDWFTVADAVHAARSLHAASAVVPSATTQEDT